MANPQAEINLQKFKEFVQSRNEHADWEDYIHPNRLDLNKKAIARDCDFDRKRITGNKAIFEIYMSCVKDLISKGLLVEDTRTASQKVSQAISSNGAARDKNALKKAQESHAATSEELHRTKKELEKAQKKLERLEKIEEYMLSTGRL